MNVFGVDKILFVPFFFISFFFFFENIWTFILNNTQILQIQWISFATDKIIWILQVSF